MRKNNNFILLIAAIWMICAVLESAILGRAVDMSLAISFLAEYIQRQFTVTSTQKMRLLSIRNFSLAAAGVFLILRIYFLFIV